MADRTDEPVRGAARLAGGEELLLTPGPLTTSRTTREAMLRDWGSRDDPFIALTSRVRRYLLDLVGGEGTHTVVLLQGSGTFAVEAMVRTLVPPDGKLLVLVNGAYGVRIVQIAKAIGRAHAALTFPEDAPVDPDAVSSALASDPAITHVVVVHCETTSGILNPLEGVAAAVASAGRRLLVDGMSSLGALPCDVQAVPFDGLASSANKCLEGVPGVAFVICRRTALVAAAGNAGSVVLDLVDQDRAMDGNGQWRFTPPTHVLAALDRAVAEHAAEGGVAGRAERYGANCRTLVAGMRALGFATLLPDRLQAPIIVTFHMPTDPRFEFRVFYERLRERGYVIYPGKLTNVPSFRIGCIGRVTAQQMRGALAAVREVLQDMGVRVPVEERV